ncbi:ribosomal protein S10 [Microthyrium microscopicum]|uniref:Small ribosomal subunit protein uS10m n=1 Tax=Microthyrium microscopicum TaxID=703497 RepID=A0A6A6UBP5_9PEZI|nr:ribosomal protein S10 [Microthyrium microscopicum]
MTSRFANSSRNSKSAMAVPSLRTALLRSSHRIKLSPNTNILRPRIQTAGLADIKDSLTTSNGTTTYEDDIGSITITEADQVNPNKQKLDDLPDILANPNLTPAQRDLLGRARIPKSLQAMYNKPLKRKPTHGIPVCNLQIRSFSVRNLELQADFALRAAYYLGLPAKGPVPLPHITERWTVPRSNFVHKKSQENFERVTVRRLIQIQDGDSEVVQCWLGYLRQRSYHGVGMKALLWENEGLGVGKRMDEEAGVADAGLETEWGNFGMRMNVKTAEMVEELLGSEAYEKPKRWMEGFWREPIEVARKPNTSSK